MDNLKLNSVLNGIEKDLNDANVDEALKKKIINNLLQLREQKINILIVGATGSGKSSTINALFGTDLEVAEVGRTPNPQTMEIEKHELSNLILWDSPGLGDSIEKDTHHAKNIANKLRQKDADGNAVIDLVLVIIDSSTRDFGTSYELINSVIIPCIEGKERIIVALNKCDKALHPTKNDKRYPWDIESNKPMPHLIVYLEEEVIPACTERIYSATEVKIDPIYYSAEMEYNISKLFYYIVKNTPKKKRVVYTSNINSDTEVWKKSDGKLNYNSLISSLLGESIIEGITDGAEIGGEFGSDIGKTAGDFIGGKVGGEIGEKIGKWVGEKVGTVIGATAGTLKGIFKSVFG